MRVTAGTYYKDYAQAVQNLHSDLNKNMQQVSTKRKYESADEDPLSYYRGKKLDNLKNTAESQDSLIKSVVGRMRQQEEGARLVQTEMQTVNKEMIQMRTDSVNGDIQSVDTLNADFDQRLQSIAQEMNDTYENYFVFGGNDSSTVPFQLTVNRSTDQDKSSVSLTYNHKFPGDENATSMTMTYTLETGKEMQITYSGTNADGSAMTGEGPITAGEAGHTNDVLDKLASAMSEQGRMQLGYGSLRYRETLPDTSTNGLNMLSGLEGETIQGLTQEDKQNGTNLTADTLQKEFARNPIALISKAILTTQNYVDASRASSGDATSTTTVEEAKTAFSNDLGDVLDEWSPAEQRLEHTYTTLGTNQALLEDTQTRLQSKEDRYTEQYTDILGIDTYDAIVQMYQKQYAYNAAMQVGSHVMQSSLFDHVNA